MSLILIVEDDPAILCGLRDNLQFESHQVLTAADGEAGYRTITSPNHFPYANCWRACERCCAMNGNIGWTKRI